MVGSGEWNQADADEECLVDPHHSLSEIDCGSGGYADSRSVLERLIRQADRAKCGAGGDRELILEIGRCPNQLELFRQFVSQRKGTMAWCRFVETVLLLPTEAWETGGGNLDEELVSMLVDTDLLKRIAQRKTQANTAMFKVVTSSGHPLFRVFNFEPYWRARVKHFMDSGDFKRAWDTLREAHRGFMISDREPEEHEEGDLKAFREDPKNRCSAASQDTLSLLVNELFITMVGHGVISGLHETDYRAPLDKVKKTVWRLGRRQAAMVENRYPARALVLSLGSTYKEIGREGCRVSTPVSNPNAAIWKFFSKPSAQAYKIARYFKDCKGAKKAQQAAAR